MDLDPDPFFHKVDPGFGRFLCGKPSYAMDYLLFKQLLFVCVLFDKTHAKSIISVMHGRSEYLKNIYQMDTNFVYEYVSKRQIFLLSAGGNAFYPPPIIVKIRLSKHGGKLKTDLN